MARYVNIFEKKNVVIRKAYDCEFGKWICEHDYMVSIETDDGRLLLFPVMSDDYLRDCTADEYLKEVEKEEVEVLMSDDCPARDEKIRENITEWICNTGCIEGSTLVISTCCVVALLSKYGMWKNEYAKHIDIERIKEEYGEE